MANIRSSKKDLRRSAKKTIRNKATRTSLKTYVKKVKTAAAAGDTSGANEALVTAVSAIDKALQRGIIHKNQAARRKSRAAKAANKAATATAPKAKAGGTKSKAAATKAKSKAAAKA